MHLSTPETHAGGLLPHSATAWSRSAIIAVLVIATTLVSSRAFIVVLRVQGEIQENADRALARQRLFSDLQDAETGQRGYLLTSDPKYLQPYEAALARVQLDKRALANSGLGEDARRHIASKLAELAQTVALVRAGDVQQALAIVRTDRGKAEMDAIRRDVTELDKQDERQVRALTDERSAALRRMAVILLLAIAGILIVLLFLARISARFEDSLRRRVEQATASLHQMVADAEAFNYSISHDLRTPLRAIRHQISSLCSAAAARLLGPDRERLDHIDRDAERMDDLITSLLAFSRVARGRIELYPVSVENAIRGALATLGFPPSITLQLSPDLPEVYAHAETLSQVLANLISNALKFSRDGVPAEVTVQAEQRGDTVAIAVRDRGIGIAPDHLQRIFLPFERLDPKRPGSGLGLAIVRRGVDRMGAELQATSQPGEGSEFLITMPVAVREELLRPA